MLDRDGRTARQAVSRLLSRGVRDSELAVALDISLSTFSRRKDKPDFPSYVELRQLAERFGVDETVLLVDFGYVDITSLNDQLRQRYASYRNALDVIKSLRKHPNPASDSELRAGVTPHRSKNIGAGCSNSDGNSIN
jgi:transcriptional regulator with XRE-family HTH domain